jgi:hypothetical protein
MEEIFSINENAKMAVMQSNMFATWWKSFDETSLENITDEQVSESVRNKLSTKGISKSTFKTYFSTLRTACMTGIEKNSEKEWSIDRLLKDVYNTLSVTSPKRRRGDYWSPPKTTSKRAA